MVVHSVLPDPLNAVIAEVLATAGITHAAHADSDVMAAAEAAASDAAAIALIGPFRSREVAEAVEATAPAGLALIAPAATWVGVTRDDEPGCDDDPADHRGTVLRLPARDTVVAQRLAADLRAAERTALVVAGDHEYGIQLDGQLAMAGLPRADDPAAADVVVLAGLAGEPEVERAAELAPLPVIAFDGVQGAELGESRDVVLALPFAPIDGVDPQAQFDGRAGARRAAELVVAGLGEGATDRASLLAALRRLGPFDEHGDPMDPPVWLWLAAGDWSLTPERPL